MGTPPHDLIIIGAGPAGLFMAQAAAARLDRVLVLEKMDRPGRKLLITGGGGCNFTHDGPVREFPARYPGGGEFLKPALRALDNRGLRAFFAERGVPSAVEDATGKVFPQSRKAGQVLDALLQACRAAGVEIRCGAPALGVRREANGFVVAAAGGELRTRLLAIASGGKSHPETGSDGGGYALAGALGHGLVAPRPGLASVAVREHPLAALSGTSFKALPVAQWRGGRKLREAAGDLVVTHKGVSGPAAQNLSRWLEPGDLLRLDLTGLERAGGYRAFTAAVAASGRGTVKGLLATHPLTEALRRLVMQAHGLDPAALAAQMTRSQRLGLYEWLTGLPLTVEGVAGFDTAMVTCGGVPLDEVDPCTLQSLRTPGLYLAGEVLDIDGECGGYDLQAAFSTAALAAGSMV